MADTSLTTNMQLTIPTPSVRTGPAYANDINNCFLRVDAHDHSSLNGVKITPAGLDLTSDVSFQTNNINQARSVRLVGQLANLSGVSDVLSIYSTGGDLWYNNVAGAQVKITSGGSLNTGAIVTNVWGTHAISGNLVILGSDSFTNVLVSSSSAINITLPAANAVSAGRYYVIQDVTGTSQTYPITITPVSGAKINGVSGAKTVSSQYGTWFIRSDATNWHLTYGSVSAITAAALTYGSAVFNSSGVTVGSVTLTSSALTIGATSLQSTGLSTQAITASGAYTGTSAHLTTNVVIDGNLTVSGSVNFPAGAVGISDITNGTIHNCAITTGTIDAAVITNGSITGATLSGGNIGTASGIATLDGSSKVPKANLPMTLMAAQQVQLTNSFDTQSQVFIDVPNSTLTLSSTQAGDIIVIDASMQLMIQNGVGLVGWARLIVNDGGTDIQPGPVANCVGSVSPFGTFSSMACLYTVATNSGSVTIRAQTRANANASSIIRLVGQSPSAGSTGNTSASTIRALQYRP